MINEELPQRKMAANTLNSDIDKTEKSMAELKEQILRAKEEKCLGQHGVHEGVCGCEERQVSNGR
ncbi:uncharacterized protein G2W53_004887 [Senna tora]|uniref:Uncharacterized protein n=1 Tax=Senna tora TaxID=362788 RepID=A0A834XCK5_9FABA|nr:uncharacterized protein G2W53_004887 [Senna tora]